MKELISLRGERDLWIDFVTKVKKDRKEVWEVLSALINSYLKNKK